MRSNKERAERVYKDYQHKRKLRKKIGTTIAVSAACVALTAVNLVLFIPYPKTPPDVGRYASSAYYPVVKQLNTLTYQPPRYKNNFEKWFGGISFGCAAKYDATGGNMLPEMMVEPKDEANSAVTFAPEYAETTDNQVQGVIEGDLFKRTNEHIFYLSDYGMDRRLRVYSIAESDSVKVEDYTVSAGAENCWFAGEAEMYLSTDCKQITILTSVNEKQENGRLQRYTVLIGLDVSNPEEVKETGRTYLSGSYHTSRLVNGTFYVVNDFYVSSNPDFDNIEEWLPHYRDGAETQAVAAEDIAFPETLTSAQYTLVCSVDEKTLAVEDSAAFLSYTGALYVSENHIFAARGYNESTAVEGEEKTWLSTVKTEIGVLAYADGDLAHKGSFSVDGSVKNQYAMDEYKGHLRVVTTYSQTKSREVTYGRGNYSYRQQISRETNACLYVTDLSNLSLRASVEKFAPDGETAESVRFAGDKAYVCTAVVVTLTDPVFAFDLQDLDKITWTDTGVIEGYSTSLIDFGDGYLLGIGYDEERNLKIEIYTETQTSVESVAKLTEYAIFSEEYKSYLIDRKNGLIGLGMIDYAQGNPGEYVYALYAFDGYEIVELVRVDLFGMPENKRAAYVDGWLYVLSESEDGFKAVKVF